MPAAKTRPTPAGAKAAAARAERNGAAKVCTWRGLKLKLPDELPATVAFDLAEVQNSDEADITSLFNFLIGLIGVDGLTTVRARVAKDGDSLAHFLEHGFPELLNAIFAPYGTDLGK